MSADELDDRRGSLNDAWLRNCHMMPTWPSAAPDIPAGKGPTGALAAVAVWECGDLSGRLGVIGEDW